jgi:hypothetical protein
MAHGGGTARRNNSSCNQRRGIVTDESNATPEAVNDAPEPQEAPTPSEREVSTTVGTGSYVAISCTVVALLVTFVILGILFLIRWL